MRSFPAFVFFLLFSVTTSFSQQVSGKLKLDQGQIFDITLQVKTSIAQQAGGQSIDFNVDATGNHSFKVTNATEDNSTLHHQVKQIIFFIDGMGRKISFDSNIEKDIDGQFGKPIKEMLKKTYDIILDTSGKVLMALPEKIQLTESDSRMAIISSLLKDVLDIVQPPQKGKASFFKVLPDSAMGKGGTWTESYTTENGKFDAAYALADINDSTIVIDFVANSVTVTKAEMMGGETTTTMNNKSTGKIFLDRNTGIIRGKNINTESSGNTESSFGNLPVTSKTTTTITVKPVNKE
ncbi:MAG TPA: DUF6263 family protein [Chitinophagaceae bacterium]|nr:DUF6263 family protein [Chitinophagaceae bacterium]